jgi:hypothetical protein
MGLSQRDYAAHRKSLGLRGATLKSIQDALADGRIRKGPDGKIDAAEADRLWLERTSVAKQRSQRNKSGERPPHTTAPCFPAGTSRTEPGGADTSYFEAQRLREWNRLKREELDLAERLESLVALAPINDWALGMIKKCREELLRIGPELRDRLAQEADPTACEQLVMQRVKRALHALAEYKHA